MWRLLWLVFNYSVLTLVGLCLLKMAACWRLCVFAQLVWKRPMSAKWEWCKNVVIFNMHRERFCHVNVSAARTQCSCSNNGFTCWLCVQYLCILCVCVSHVWICLLRRRGAPSAPQCGPPVQGEDHCKYHTGPCYNFALYAYKIISEMRSFSELFHHLSVILDTAVQTIPTLHEAPQLTLHLKRPVLAPVSLRPPFLKS